MESTELSGSGHEDRAITVLLRRMHSAVAQAGSAQDRLDLLVRAIAGHAVADVCSIYLRRPDDELELYATEGLNAGAVHSTRLKWGEGLVGLVARNQRPLVTTDAPLHPAFSYRPETGEEPLRSFLGVPLIRSGKVLGVLVVQSRIPHDYTDAEIEAVQGVGSLLAEIAASGELLSKKETAEVGAMLLQPEKLKGFGVVSGIAIGKVVFLKVPAPKHKVFSNNPADEAARLEEGLVRLRTSVDRMVASSSTLDSVSRDVLESYRLFAYDRGWKDRLRSAVFSGLTAESAVQQVMGENKTRLLQARDPYMRERLYDLDDLSNRLQHLLSGKSGVPRYVLEKDSILVARTLGPAQLLEFERGLLNGLVLSENSVTSHAAIVARALDIPMVTGLHDAMERAEESDRIIIDGDFGEIHIRPPDSLTEEYRRRQRMQKERQAVYFGERNLPAVTQDGTAVSLMMNAGLAFDMPLLEKTNCEGVGLFRTELQFLIGDQLPSVASQKKLYEEILDAAKGKPVIFRTADIGADKMASYMEHWREENPAMGWRGLRLAVDRPGILRPQLRALIAAAAGRSLYVMFPFVTVPEEMDEARKFLDREVERAEKCGQRLPAVIRIGAMIETPASAWYAGIIASRADFLSIGGNDLAQFYFAADRDSARVQRRYDILDPGFLGFLKMTVDKAKAAGVPLSYCGEHATDPVSAAALLGIGITGFSIPSSAAGPFRRLVRSVHAGNLGEWLHARMDLEDGTLRKPFTDYLRSVSASIE